MRRGAMQLLEQASLWLYLPLAMAILTMAILTMAILTTAMLTLATLINYCLSSCPSDPNQP
jgi:hypothetical protein